MQSSMDSPGTETGYPLEDAHAANPHTTLRGTNTSWHRDLESSEFPTWNGLNALDGVPRCSTANRHIYAQTANQRTTLFDSSTLEGLMSLWTMLLAWRYCRP